VIKVNQKTGQIYLYGSIGPEQWGGEISETDVIEALDSLKGKRAKVHINSVGGVIDTGIAIHSLLKSYEPGVDVYVDSLAASIASVIALAGESRVTAEGSRWMIHRARAGFYGTASEVRKRLEQTDAYDRSMVEIYASYLGKEQAEIESMLDAETWFTAEEAVAAGLATKKAGKTSAKPKIAAWFDRPPVDLVAACTEEKPVTPVRRQAAKLRIFPRA
jgi:ATP-dependent protease ClpP protease subunit